MRRPYLFGVLGLAMLICYSAGSFALPLAPYLDNAPMDDSDNENTPSIFFPLADVPNQNPVLRSEDPERLDSPKSLAKWLPLKAKILADFGSRMTPEFAIPPALTERTSFWLDIYTRYGANHFVIHHVLYPWIVYKVIDVSPWLNMGKGPEWLRRERSEKFVKQQQRQIRAALVSLSRRKSFDHLPPLEQDLFDRLAKLPGARAQVLRVAAGNVRTQLGQRDFYGRGLINSGKYMSYMEEEFRHAGLPTELVRLPFVESSFNEEARSRVGASGVWQIMPRTGKSYMIVNDTIDERNSPLKATLGAARLLRSNFRAMGSWALAITSYNNGYGNIQKAIRAAKSHDLPTIIERYHRGDFRFASANYFACFLAALYAEKYNELVFKDVPREPLRERELVRLNKATGVRQLSRVYGVSATEIQSYNLDLRTAFKRGATLPRGYVLHLPARRRLGQLALQEGA